MGFRSRGLAMSADRLALPVLPALLASVGTFWVATFFIDASSRPLLLPIIYGVGLLLPAAGVVMRRGWGVETRRLWFLVYVLAALVLTFLIAFTNQVYWPVVAMINSAMIAEILASMRYRPLSALFLYLGKVVGIAIIAVLLFGLSIFAPNPAGYVIAAVPLVLLAASPSYRQMKWMAAAEVVASIAYLTSATVTHKWVAEHSVWGSPVGYSGAAALVGVISTAVVRDQRSGGQHPAAEGNFPFR